jgi:hypothetical protein
LVRNGALGYPVNTHLLRAFDLWRVMRVVGVDNEGKDESATLIHAYTNHTMISGMIDC